MKQIRLSKKSTWPSSSTTAIQNLPELAEKKISKYELIATDFHALGWTVFLDAVVVGSFGSWDPANEPALKALRISPRYA